MFHSSSSAGRVGCLGEASASSPFLPADLEWAVVLTPQIDLPDKTATMFSKVGPMSYTNGGLTRKLAARLSSKGDTPPQFLFNAFDDVAKETFPILETYWDTFHALGAREIHLCGAGPSLYAPVSTKAPRHRYPAPASSTVTAGKPTSFPWSTTKGSPFAETGKYLSSVKWTS